MRAAVPWRHTSIHTSECARVPPVCSASTSLSLHTRRVSWGLLVSTGQGRGREEQRKKRRFQVEEREETELFTGGCSHVCVDILAVQCIYRTLTSLSCNFSLWHTNSFRSSSSFRKCILRCFFYPAFHSSLLSDFCPFPLRHFLFWFSTPLSLSVFPLSFLSYFGLVENLSSSSSIFGSLVSSVFF